MLATPADAAAHRRAPGAGFRRQSQVKGQMGGTAWRAVPPSVPVPIPEVVAEDHALNAVHRAAARMVDFGGWDMPVHYGFSDRRAPRVPRRGHVRRLAHASSSTSARLPQGRRADPAFLRHLVANNVDKLAVPGKALYTCMLAEDGGVRRPDRLLCARDFFRVVVNGDRGGRHRVVRGLRDRLAPSASGCGRAPTSR